MINLVSDWIALRREMNIPGDVLFVASVTGKARFAGQPMHSTSIFRRTHAFLEALNIHVGSSDPDKPGARVCAQTLRNTYAASLFVDGAPDELVTEYMGLTSILSAQRLRASWGVMNGLAPVAVPLSEITL